MVPIMRLWAHMLWAEVPTICYVIILQTSTICALPIDDTDSHTLNTKKIRTLQKPFQLKETPAYQMNANTDECSFLTHVCNRTCISLESQRKEIAVFSYNFGNYRDEVRGLLPLHNFVPSVNDYDWFFFMDSDSTYVSSLGWTTCVTTIALNEQVRYVVEHHETELSPSLTETWSLVLTKWFKFGHIPAVLRSFKYIVHADSSTFAQNHNFYAIPNITFLRKVISKSSAQLFLCAHPRRSRVVDEFHVTVKVLKKENATNLAHWRSSVLEELAYPIEIVPVFSMGIFVRKVGNYTHEVSDAFENVFKSMVKYGLRRDQNVLPFEVIRHFPSPRDQAPCVFTIARNTPHRTCKNVRWPAMRKEETWPAF